MRICGDVRSPTLGHKALIEDCLRLFDEVAVAVMINPDKRPFLRTRSGRNASADVFRRKTDKDRVFRARRRSC
ncbi:MAG: hypothetical protein ACLR06_06120 [Christensenellaceae bacterium]